MAATDREDNTKGGKRRDEYEPPSPIQKIGQRLSNAAIGEEFSIVHFEPPKADSGATPATATSAPAEPAPVPQPVRRKRGPKPDTIRRFDKADRSLFPEIDRLMQTRMSLHAATLELAREKRVAGTGTDESKAARLRRAYRRENPQ
jgi:hypothetical protein